MLFRHSKGGEHVVDLLEHCSFLFLCFKTIDYFSGFLLTKFLVFEQLIGNHKTLIISLLY